MQKREQDMLIRKVKIMRNKMYILIKNLTATKFTKEVLKEYASGNKRVFLNNSSTEFVVEFNEKIIISNYILSLCNKIKIRRWESWNILLEY